MEKKFWTRGQIPELKEFAKQNVLPQKVVDVAESNIEILDKYYGAERNVDNDDGGYICMIVPKHGKSAETLCKDVLKKYQMGQKDFEFHDFICDDGNNKWYLDLFLVTNDYGIVLIYPKRCDLV